MHNNRYDVVIIGAGFAGLACARELAHQGLRTLVLEKKPWPGTKVHTTGIVVKELAEVWHPPARLTKKISQVRLYSPRLDYIDLRAPGYYFLATDTRALLRWHAEQAIQAGATLRYDSHYRASSFAGDYHSFGGSDLRSRYLIGCDGVQSQVARRYALGRNRDLLFGIEAEFEPVPGLSDDHLHVFLDRDIACGYIAWMVPGVQVTQIGLATRMPVRPVLDKFLHKLAPLWRIDKAAIKSIRSGLIPCGGMVDPFYGDEVMLLGDAAGMVSPLTGGGIQPAVHFGARAGTRVADYLLQQGGDPGRALRPELPGYACKRSLRFLLDHLPFNNRVCADLFRTPAFRALAQTIFFHHRGLFSAAAWRDLLHLGVET